MASSFQVMQIARNPWKPSRPAISPTDQAFPSSDPRKCPDEEDIREFWKTHLDRDTDRPFSLVSEKLLAIGTLTVDQFLHSSSADSLAYDNPEIVLEVPQIPSPPPLEQDPQSPTDNTSKDVTKTHSKMKFVATLHETCQRAFGSTDALRFEFLEEGGSNSKQCILTIVRPNNVSRSYATKPNFSRKNDAKAQAAALAVEMGAIDFIIWGDADGTKAKNGLVLAPLDVSTQAGSDAGDHDPSESDDGLIREIEDCCMKWRAGLVKPQWIPLMESKILSKHGYALRINLSKHCYRVHSCETSFNTPLAAKKACAQIAHDDGVLDFIKFGNGQTEPAPAAEASDAGTEIHTPAGSLTLQKFYEALPQPFPEPVNGKSAAEINSSGWLNSLIQSARGGKLTAKYIWISEISVGLHGCLLRISRPGESKSYLVDPRFHKRADAKAAVGLQAMSEGVGNYVRSIGEAAARKIDAASKLWANEHVLPAITSAYQQIYPGALLPLDYPKDRDAFGCTLKLDLSASPSPQETRTYTVPTEYRTKPDARIALACLAAEEGAIEFLKFRGQTPPEDWVPFVSFRGRIGDIPQKKRKELDRSTGNESRPQKKSKVEQNAVKLEAGEIPMLETKEEAMTRLANERARKGSTKHKHEGGWNKSDRKRPLPRGAGVGPFAPPALAGPSESQCPPLPGYDDASTLAYKPPVVFEPYAHPPYPAVARDPHVHGWPSEPYVSYVETRPTVYQIPPFHPSPGPFPPTAAYSPVAYLPPVHYASSSVPPPPYPPIYPQPPPQTGGYNLAPEPYPLSAPYPPSLPYPYPPPHMAEQGYYAPPPVQPPPTHAEPPPMAHPAPVPHLPPPCAPAPSVPTEPRSHRAPLPPPVPPAPPTTSAPPPPSPPPFEGPSENNGVASRSEGTKSDSNLTTISSYNALLEYCKESRLPKPHFRQETVTIEGHENKYQVWAIMGKERLELPLTYSTVSEGRERLAKQVLARLKKTRDT